jgi:hypothetical protein
MAVNLSAHVDLKPPPRFAHLLPEPHLKALVVGWKLEDFFSGKRGDGYVDWLRGEIPSLAKLHGYIPTPGQLRQSVSASIATEEKFLTYLMKEGGAKSLDDKEKLEDLATAGAAVILTLYMESERYGT